MKYDNLFVVDVEATTPTPASGDMTEFAVGHVNSGSVFYARLWRSHPDPEVPARPVLDLSPFGEPYRTPMTAVYSMDEVAGSTVADVYPEPTINQGSFGHVFHELHSWIKDTHPGSGTLVSDNPAYDAMWLNFYSDQFTGRIPLGFSGRRIGDFAAGLEGNWSGGKKWKNLRSPFRHTHNPADDVMGNISALRKLLAIDRDEQNGNRFA